MVIVAGHITVEPQPRESSLADGILIVEQAREAPGCLDFAISADLIDPSRINIFERWESQAAVETFRGNGPSDEQGAAMRSVSVAEYDIADVRRLFWARHYMNPEHGLATTQSPGGLVDRARQTQREGNHDHEADDHHMDYRRRRDAGTRWAGRGPQGRIRAGRMGHAVF